MYMKVELCVNHMGTTWELQRNMMRTCLEHIGNIEEKQKTKNNMDHGGFFLYYGQCQNACPQLDNRAYFDTS
jgi:hypothetical protein